MEVDDVVMTTGDDETSTGLVLRSYLHVCCCGLNVSSPPGLRK